MVKTDEKEMTKTKHVLLMSATKAGFEWYSKSGEGHFKKLAGEARFKDLLTRLGLN